MIEQLPLRQAVPADVAIVRDLARLAYTKWVPVFGREPLPMTANYINPLLNTRLISLRSGEAAGSYRDDFCEEPLLIETSPSGQTNKARGLTIGCYDM
jgi:hypothetical protein